MARVVRWLAWKVNVLMEWPSRLNTRRHNVLTTRDQNNPQRQKDNTFNDNTGTCVTCCWLLDKGQRTSLDGACLVRQARLMCPLIAI